MNWGKGLIIGMGIFMLFIVAMVISMFNQPVDDYDKQYYEKGLAYDSTYNKEKQVITDNAKPVLSIAGNNLKVVFAAPAKVQLHFNRPSDRKMDVIFTMETNKDNSINIPLNGLATGQWQVTIDWESNKKQYLYKQEIFIP
ncbi:MAG: nitrogen fixation protein FixH [Sphingobacteriaceae bacterium]|nr:MAG: nitrogen fixation protein FixH [Sphingobacteriaceae bacterium]